MRLIQYKRSTGSQQAIVGEASDLPFAESGFWVFEREFDLHPGDRLSMFDVEAIMQGILHDGVFLWPHPSQATTGHSCGTLNLGEIKGARPLGRGDDSRA